MPRRRAWPGPAEGGEVRISPRTSATVPTTRTFPAKQQARRGAAASDERIVPEPYSPVTDRTPNTPMASEPRARPARDWLVGSKPWTSGPRGGAAPSVDRKRHDQCPDGRDEQRPQGRPQRGELGQLGPHHLAQARSGSRVSNELAYGHDVSPLSGPAARTAPCGVSVDRYSTASLVSSMKASSSEARRGASSCTVSDRRRPARRSRRRSCRVTTMAPSSSTAAGPRLVQGRDEASASASPRRTACRGTRAMNSSTLVSAIRRAPSDHHQPLGRERHLVDEVAGDEDRPALGGQIAQQVADPADALGVETVDRFVEEQDAGIAEQRAGDARAAGPCPARTCRPACGPPRSARRCRAPRRRGRGDVVGPGQGQRWL